ncbi:MAG: hypothetical protein GY801_14800, partial [bacterium]|nr:hypothetical protein [bacterium]
MVPRCGTQLCAPRTTTSSELPWARAPLVYSFWEFGIPTGEGQYTIHQRKRHQEVQAHLEVVLERDPEACWIVVLDNASAHTTPKLDEFLPQHQDRLALMFQPTYSPHLNLIER